MNDIREKQKKIFPHLLIFKEFPNYQDFFNVINGTVSVISLDSNARFTILPLKP